MQSTNNNKHVVIIGWERMEATDLINLSVGGLILLTRDMSQLL